MIIPWILILKLSSSSGVFRISNTNSIRMHNVPHLKQHAKGSADGLRNYVYSGAKWKVYDNQQLAFRSSRLCPRSSEGNFSSFHWSCLVPWCLLEWIVGGWTMLTEAKIEAPRAAVLVKRYIPPKDGKPHSSPEEKRKKREPSPVEIHLSWSTKWNTSELRTITDVDALE